MLKDIFPFLFLVVGLLVLTLVVEQDNTYGKELEDRGLFQPLGPDEVEQEYLFEDTMMIERMRLVDVDFAQLDMATEQVRLNLFDDVIITAVRDYTVPNATGDGLVWVGKVERMPNSQVILVTQGGSFVGTILLTNSGESGSKAAARAYEVRPVLGGYRVQEIQHRLPDDYRLGSAHDISLPIFTAPA